jgi:hypothetical protein
VTPVPATVIAVAALRPLPVNVIGILVPGNAVLGVIVVSMGPSTVKLWVLLPPGIVTLTVLPLIVAVAEIVNVVVIVVEFTTVIAPTVTPVPDTVRVIPVVAKFVPVSVTETLVPRRPLLGVIRASVGAGGLTTVNEKC